ncbi:MAG: nucleotidyl transferase AbiEii/AbiGii toxin family protein [Ignavibacteriae bacterium]|nr:nucleotidyl transferase AbiEii/AbiGii toxin family protein [Ignavibacteriota bacterium]
MLLAQEDRRCYSAPSQRETLLALLRHEAVAKDFFLTGGTALSVFYLHHRRSNDLDLFTLRETSLDDIDLALKTEWSVKALRPSSTISIIVTQARVGIAFGPLKVAARELISSRQASSSP